MPGIRGSYFFGSGRASFASEIDGKRFREAIEPKKFKSVLSGSFSGGTEPEATGQFDSARYLIKNSIVADACLTNRTELFTKFGVLPSQHAAFTDEHLILRAYEKWGEDCVEHLSGDFAFAVYDNRKLFCARDHLGNSKLFYYKDHERFIFASSPSGILGFEGVEERLNKNKLSVFLLPEPHLLSINESWFENIFPLPAGSVLTVDSNGLKQRKYWKPELRTSLPYKSEEDILEAFRELIFEIFSDRVGDADPVTALLSGGLDSSSVVSVSAKILEKQNRRITVIAGVLDQQDSRFADEREYIDQFKTFPNVDIEYVTSDDWGPFSNLEDFFLNFDSPIVTSRHYLYRNFISEAEKLGSKTLFEGGMGEFGPTTYGYGGFAEMFREFKWSKLRRELILREKLYGESARYGMRAHVLNPHLPDFLARLKRGFKIDQQSIGHEHPLSKVFLEKLLSNNDSPRPFERKIFPDHRKNQLNDISFVFGKSSEVPSSTFGKEDVELRNPLLDKRLVEFSLAAPLDLKIRDGYTRYLIRAGLDKVLPPKIQWRTTKSPFSPDYMRRYHKQIGSVKQMLNDISPNDPLHEVLDIKKITQWVDHSIRETGEFDAAYERFAFSLIPTSIYLIYFLRRFPEFRL